MVIHKLVSQIIVGNQQKKLYIKIAAKTDLLQILWTLYQAGYISGFKMIDPFIYIYLKYQNGRPVIQSIKQMSRISRRVYIKFKTINKPFSLLKTTYVLATTKGILLSTDLNFFKYRVGGEFLFKIN